MGQGKLIAKATTSQERNIKSCPQDSSACSAESNEAMKKEKNILCQGDPPHLGAFVTEMEREAEGKKRGEMVGQVTREKKTSWLEGEGVGVEPSVTEIRKYRDVRGGKGKRGLHKNKLSMQKATGNQNGRDNISLRGTAGRRPYDRATLFQKRDMPRRWGEQVNLDKPTTRLPALTGGQTA